MNAQAPGEEFARRALEHLRALRFADAERAADMCLSLSPDDRNGLYFKGVARLFQGDGSGALAVLDRALEVIGADNPRGRFLCQLNRCRALMALDRFADAQGAIEECLSVEPGSEEARLKLGEALLSQSKAEDALCELDKIATHGRHGARAAARKSEALELLGRAEDAARAADDAIARAPDDVVVARVWANNALDRGEAVKVAAHLADRADDPAWPPDERMLAWSLVGKARERERDFAGAHAAFAHANQVQIDRLAAAPAGFALRDTLAAARATREMIANAPEGYWSDPEADDPSPVFLIGFPRSGTTLLDQILSSHAECTVIEERQDLHAPIWKALGGGAEKLLEPGLAPGEEDRLRAEYDAGLSRYAGEPRARVVIDKLPLLLTSTPVLRRLWPNARFILALRDPRDAVLSNYQQAFVINSDMAAMLRLETAAAFYDAAQGVFADLRARASCRVFEIRYEDVVDDMEGAVAALLSFLDLPWDDGVRAYAETARKRAIRTPSARAVRQPIYRSAVGRWRAYRDQLAPVLETLAPWAERFGYPEA